VSTVLKRANFDLSPEQEAQILHLKEQLGAASIKEAVLRAAQLTSILADEAALGNRLFVGKSVDRAARLLLPGLERPARSWQWLVSREHPWRRQLWVKGRKTLASTIWGQMRASRLTAEQAAEDWDLPLEAIAEIEAYCTEHAVLIAAEAAEEGMRLKARGVAIEAARR
jgi:hypothetical protein